MAGKNGRKQRFDSNAQTSSFSERPQLSRIFFAEYHCFTRREIAVPPLGQAQKKAGNSLFLLSAPLNQSLAFFKKYFPGTFEEIVAVAIWKNFHL
jgi:hypothetical protein